MKNNFREDFLEELKEINVSEKEAEEFLQIAFRLNNLSMVKRSYEFKKAKAQKITSIKNNSLFHGFIVSLLGSFAFPIFTQKVNKRILIPAFAAVVLLFGTFSIVWAQKSLPGETLYPVKRAAENVILKVNPNFKQEIIQRRVEENKVIQENKKSTELKQEEAKENKKEEEKKEESKDTVNNIEENKNVTVSPKEEIKENKKEDINENDQKVENEVKNNNVKGAKIKESTDNNQNNKKEETNKSQKKSSNKENDKWEEKRN